MALFYFFANLIERQLGVHSFCVLEAVACVVG